MEVSREYDGGLIWVRDCTPTRDVNVTTIVADLLGTEFYVGRSGELRRFLDEDTFFSSVEEAEEAIALYLLKRPA